METVKKLFNSIVGTLSKNTSPNNAENTDIGTDVAGSVINMSANIVQNTDISRKKLDDVISHARTIKKDNDKVRVKTRDLNKSYSEHER